MSYFGATVLNFWQLLLWVSKPDQVLLYSNFGGECTDVLYNCVILQVELDFPRI